ncbi:MULTISPECIES: MdtA/MuxA family multidrug efflux RND transporter periplasmic adaptor subunit [unclassified Tatumella]|uniref:MdtA/MuxA family multidrug efflux RND transporter periplasmic adaptor subunit n=1 Tax=unclassified Tatumella TaxID=2649542 RepID=UPI001BAFD1AE|nr:MULTISPECIES: MdtA/MuxA family multidrug efflux RND transporter periplasmic adaptor subunit [unclassified Tatumella]MBS0854791.1 MdtA/MuxA family multidrug efflux RND transporter periplasmic adaptor subunit [Tatumella sp. JGM16]MBS0878431.1 MdtA/MuxA family multidrug efflux RND transporter periplasmic adaptor subunit [Tatumella sp. JGM82]MBS0892007.1 MdtA/MuxA family multidrug efflux RND transporter periplasmic adaptor subunit [Tatumella sp. JGM94]MBS0903125.1 MdtA/MuxA family multidrug effl
MRAKYRMTTVVLFLLIIIALILAGIHSWHGKSVYSTQQARDRQSSAIPVQVAVARRETVPLFISALGTVNASSTVTVRSRVDGQLMSLHFKEGDTVTAGQLLADIDPRPFRVALLQAQGQLAKDQATLSNARNDLRRYQKLAATRLVSQQDLDNQQAVVRESEGSVKSDQAAVDNAQLNLTYSQVTAPISGTVGLKQVDAGNYITASDTGGIVVITQTQPADVIFTVPEGMIDQIVSARSEGTPLRVEARDRTDSRQLSEGQLLSLDNQIDSTTGTLKIKARFANQDNRLFPNQFVNIRLQVNTLKDALVIPVAALQMNTDGPFVWVVSPQNTVSRKEVTTGPQQDMQAVITAGLSAGDKVVTDGIDRLNEGSVVDIVQGVQQLPASDNTTQVTAP